MKNDIFRIIRYCLAYIIYSASRISSVCARAAAGLEGKGRGEKGVAGFDLLFSRIKYWRK